MCVFAASQGEPRPAVEEEPALGRPHFPWCRRQGAESNFLKAQAKVGMKRAMDSRLPQIQARSGRRWGRDRVEESEWEVVHRKDRE